MLDHYAVLTEAEIKTLVVEDKWIASIRAALEGEVQRVSHFAILFSRRTLLAQKSPSIPLFQKGD